MHIPPSLKIAGITYEIKYNNGKIETEDEDGNEIVVDTIANVNFIDCTINISESVCEQVVDLSFMHEVVHAILFAMGHQLGGAIEHDETFIEGYAQILLQVMQQIIEYNVMYEDYQLMMEEEMKEIPEPEPAVHWYLEEKQ